MPVVVNASQISLDRMVRAVEKVREGLLKATGALEAASVPYAVAGADAVAAWVTTVDEAAVRNTRDVDTLLRRADLPAAINALKAVGFVYRRVADLDIFLDGPDAKARDAVRIVFAGERVRAHEPVANPDVDGSAETNGFRVLSLQALVQIKLTAFRDKDRTHLRDFVDVGLLDETWPAHFPPLDIRLQTLLDDPNG